MNPIPICKVKNMGYYACYARVGRRGVGDSLRSEITIGKFGKVAGREVFLCEGIGHYITSRHFKGIRSKYNLISVNGYYDVVTKWYELSEEEIAWHIAMEVI